MQELNYGDIDHHLDRQLDDYLKSQEEDKESDHMIYQDSFEITKESGNEVRLWNGKKYTLLTDKQVEDLCLEEKLWYDIFEARGR